MYEPIHVAKPTDHLISVGSGPWALLLKLGSFYIIYQQKRDRHNQPGKSSAVNL